MPRVIGVMELLPGTYGAPNTKIKSAPYNAQLDDFVAEMNSARPSTAGGTGATTAVGGADNLSTTGANIASAATTDIGAATGVNVTITGTTTITAFGTKTAGVKRWLTFTGALLLVHNATSLILPGGNSINVKAGSTATFLSLGGGNWALLNYQQGDGGIDGVAIGQSGASLGSFTFANATRFRSNSFDSGNDAGGAALTANSAIGKTGGAVAVYGETHATTPGDVSIGYGNGINGITEGYHFTKATGASKITGLLDLSPATSGQIKFPASQNASADANTLDDYEEGTFTPTFSATGCTFSYSAQTGKYTKIGNAVIASVDVTLNTSGNTLAANALSFAGFPFAASGNHRTSIAWNSAGSSYVNMIGVLANATTAMGVRGLTAAGASLEGSALLANAVLSPTTGSRLAANIVYLT